MDMRKYMGLATLTDAPPFLILIAGAGLEIGVRASDVFDVVNIVQKSLVPVPGADNDLISGITPDGLTLLDAEALLRQERTRAEVGA